MNVAAVRWLRLAARLGMILAALGWAGTALWQFAAFGPLAGAALGPGPGAGPPLQFILQLGSTSFLTALPGFMTSALLYVACEIALHLHRERHPEPDE